MMLLRATRWLMCVAAVLVAAIGPTQAGAGPILVDAGWYGFCFGGPGSPATEGCRNEGIGTTGNPFTFTALGPALLKVTDAFLIGDVFDVFVNSTFAFTTSTPGSGPTTSNPDVAFASGFYSAGSLLLGAGDYSVDVFASASPFGAGGAYLEVRSASAPIPEPASIALVGTGVGLALLLRRRVFR